MPRTTEQWEQLLDGTTPGPWSLSESAWEPHDIRTEDQELWIATTGDGDDGVDRRKLADALLIAAAPELAAELYRIRYEMEERVRIWRKVTDKLEARGDTSGAEAIRHTISVVTRILEGDTDE